MKIIIHDDFHILFYPFTLGRWLTTEVRRCMRSSKRSKRQHGKNRTLRIVLFTNTRAKKPCLHRFGVHKGVISYMVHVPYIGGGWSEPTAYAEPVHQWLKGMAFVMRECHLDSSRFEQRIPALLDEFCSDPSRIVPDWIKAPKPVPTSLPKWKVPRDLKRRLAKADGSWEDERYDPLFLRVSPDTSYDGPEIPIRWQIEFDPFDERLEAAGERLERRGIEPDSDAWSSVIQKAFRKRFPKLARELHDDSESSTCVLWVESESACKKLVKLIWSILFKK